MTFPFSHQPVLAKAVAALFHQKAGKILVDATAGGGGHLLMLAHIVGQEGKIFAFDRDIRAHQNDAAGGVASLCAKQIVLVHAAFSSIKEILAMHHIDHVDGILADLGVSSNQLDDRSRGFSFLTEGPIDMRMDTSQGLSAFDWLAHNSEIDIANILFTLGGERKSRAIARLIKKSWPIENSTLALAKIVLQAVRQRKWSKIHPATRTFQALRMAVNHEVSELSTLLSLIPKVLNIGGIAVFISFHSVEDRLVKAAFKNLAQKDSTHQDMQFKILTKKPILASPEEILANRRSRSAKLRAIMRVS